MSEGKFPTKGNVAAHDKDQKDWHHGLRIQHHEPEDFDFNRCTCDDCQPPTTGRWGQVLRRIRRRNYAD